MSDYESLSASEIADKVSKGEMSAIEITRQALESAKTEGKKLNAFITLCEEKALRQAKRIDEMPKEEKQSLPLCGVPIAIKDNISYTDYTTTCGSHILEGYIPPYDATVVTRLIDAGAVIIGKTNMDEFAMGSSNENSYFGPVKNPIDNSLAPGGSSGGSAAAVAQKIVPIAYGSETGGSVRQPASFCGTYGLKPTYGGISRYGLVAFASSTDQISPFARTVRDLARAYKVPSGRDECDSTSVAHEHPNYPEMLESDRKFRIGIPKEYFAEGLEKEVEEKVRSAIATLESDGHNFVEVSLPMTDNAIAVYYVVICAEASSNLARFDGVKFGLRMGGDKPLIDMYRETRGVGFGPEVKRRIMLGTYVLSSGYYEAYYHRAGQVRELMRREFDEAFKKVDLIISPTSPTTAFRLGERIEDLLAMYLSDVYTCPSSLTGNPALSVPCGSDSRGRPVGVQFIAPYFNETALFQIARRLEQLA